MKKIFFLVFFVLSSLFLVLPTHGQTSPLPEEPTSQQEYFVKAKVLQVMKEKTQDIDGFKTLTQIIKLQILEGQEANKVITIEYGNDMRIAQSQKMNAETQVILDVLKRPGTSMQYTITDTYRLNYLMYIAIAFFLFTVLIAGKKGLGAIIGLCISLAVIMLFIVPQILHHQDP